MRMEIKLNYEAPEAEMIPVRMEHGLLQASDPPVKVTDYDPWEEEDI